jgi:ubiquitin-conjugating enzyme E2 O
VRQILTIRVTGVRFKDPAGAAMKYDGTAQVGGSNHKNIVSRVLPSATLGFDLNVYIILSLKTKATVLWQDCSMTTEESTTLIPDINLEDESEVWPGEAVVSQESASAPGHDWILQPKRVGVVQSVSASDRLATVLWLPDAKLQYHNIDDLDGFMPPALLPGSTLGLTLHPHATPHLNTPSNAVSEDVTLYDIRAAFVISFHLDIYFTNNDIETVSISGEEISLFYTHRRKLA